MSRFWIPQIPGHAWHEKSLQRQQAVGPLVNSQEQTALLVPLVVRLCSSIGLHRISLVRASGESFKRFVLLGKRSGDLSSMPWRVRGTLVSWANCSVGVQSCPAPPRRPAVCPDPTRPCYVRVLDSTSWFGRFNTLVPVDSIAAWLVILDLSGPKPGHTTGGSGRGGARWGGQAERGQAGWAADGSVHLGDNRPSCSPRHRGQLS